MNKEQSPKQILTALLKTVNDCGSKLHIEPCHLFKYKMHIQSHCLSISGGMSCLKASIKYTNIPGDKSCIVPLPGLSQQLYVSPEKETKDTNTGA